MTIRMNNEPRNQCEIQSENLLVFMPHLFLKYVCVVTMELRNLFNIVQ